MADTRPNGRWFRDIYRDAVWESEELTAQEKAVAETYARHARDEHDDKSAAADLAWTTYPRLMAKAGIGRRANVSTAVASLVEKGWLTVVREVSRRPTLYRLTIPTGSSTPGTTEMEGASSTPGTTVVPPSQSGSSTSGAGSSDGGTQPLGPLENQPSTSSLSARTSLPGPRDPGDDRERDESTTSEEPQPTWHERLVIEANCPPEHAAAVVAWIQREYPDRGTGWWRHILGNGDLAEIVRKALDALANGGQSGCTTCGGTGTITRPGVGTYGGDVTEDCPTCQPLSNKRIKAFTDMLAGQPPCPCGEEGGNIELPGTKWMACPRCRAANGFVHPEVRDRQLRSSERGRTGNANGDNAREWMALRPHQPYSNPPPEAYDDWLDLPTGQPDQTAIEASPTL